MAMQFAKKERSCFTESGWRLATVKEAQDNRMQIEGLLQEWDRARLLDGWIGGSAYGFEAKVGFRSCVGYMLVVSSPTPEISSSDDIRKGLYDNAPIDEEEGMNVALLLCCEDWNYEVVCWLLNRWSLTGCNLKLTRSEIERSAIPKASKFVSHIARKLQSIVGSEIPPGSPFSKTWMRDMVNQIVGKMEFMWDDIMVSRVELRDDVLNDMDWKEDSSRLKDFGLDTASPGSISSWEAIANTLGYVVADYAAVAIVRNCVDANSKSIIEPKSTGDKMEDVALIASMIGHVNCFFRYNNTSITVGNAADDAKGDIRLFEKEIRGRGCGTFSYSGNHFLNKILLEAAKKGNVNLVQRLLEFGLRLLGTDDKRKKTALHHAAQLDSESNGMQIAKMLLTANGGATATELANAPDYKQRTPLHRACFCGNVDICKLLIAHNSSVSSKDKNGQTPLHYALCSERPNENVVRVLISAERKQDGCTSSTCAGKENDVSLVDSEDNRGKTPLDVAVDCQSYNVRIVTWLLSLSKKPERYFEGADRQSYIRESARSGYVDLVKRLLNAGADPLDGDKEGKTTLHYAAEGEDEKRAMEIIKELKTHGDAQFRSRDKYGRTVLHLAAFVGHKELCQMLLSMKDMDLEDSKDSDDQNALYYAVAGPHDNDEVLDVFIWGGFSGQVSNRVYLKDSSKTTPLQVAASRGNFRMVRKLLSNIKREDRQKYVREADRLGQTALHKAASGGHKKIVRKLLENGAHPLEERDCDGKTALHYAAQAENDEDAKAIAELLFKNCTSDKEKSLLLFASAVGIGSAEECLRNRNSLLKKYLCNEKDELWTPRSNLLRDAATLGNIDMTRELLTRGAKISDIRDPKWRGPLGEEEERNVKNVLKQIDNIVEQGTDKPALWDTLGRTAYANGLATLFLNPFVKSPITIGISGEWGMGKSSLMVQTESILLKTAAQLAFSNPLQEEMFPGAGKAKLSKKGEAKREKIEETIKRLSATERPDVWKRLNAMWDKFNKFAGRLFQTDTSSQTKTQKEKNQLSDFLGSYEPKYHEVYKSLAVMDRRDLFEDDKEEEESKSSHHSGMYQTPGIYEGQIQGSIPSILTVRYNAWHYRSESEAWAGLAVEITRELEATMTVAQRLRTSWKYNWTSRKRTICIQVMLPCFLAVFLAIWCTIIVWLTLNRVKGHKAKDFKDVRYGSLSVTGIVMVWAVVKSVMSVVKPISSQMVDYIFLPDHSGKLGYHQKVISDIKFLKGELGYKPSWLWELFAFIWCCITFCWDENYIPGTAIPKMTPAPNDNLRMVVFVDDLDRCQENVILQILSAANLVLAACEINVILGMDKRMIERAIIRMFGDKNKNPSKSSEDLADKYLRKIIQLPLDLPDPSSSESKSFLEKQLGILDTRKGETNSGAATETQTAHAHQKLNPKFRIGTFNRRNPDPVAGDQTMACLGGTSSIKERDNISGNGSLGKKTNGGETMRLLEEKQHRMETREPERDVKIPIDDTADSKRLPTGENPDAGEDEGCSVSSTVTTLKDKTSTNSVDTQPENIECDKKLVEISSITSEMLIPKYSEGEREAFLFLETKATGSRKLPREWKRLLNYHRLAWNILSKGREVKTLAGWQVQLIAWVFVCWQWKDPINILIENWGDLGVLKNWITVNDDEQGRIAQKNSGPSLREIVEHYIEERLGRKDKNRVFDRDSLKRNAGKEGNEPLDKAESESSYSNTEQNPMDSLETLKTMLLQDDNWLREIRKKVLGEQQQRDQGEQIQRLKGKAQRTQATKREEEDGEKWTKLRETLTQFNVSMDGIQAFQKFRFYCVPGHLPWPLANTQKMG